MKYNFDERIDRRNTASAKWRNQEEQYPFWVADMDFRSPQPVIDALVERAAHGVFGYANKGAAYNDAVVNWYKKRYGYELDSEWIVFTSGVVSAMRVAERAFGFTGQGVIIQPPVYAPFRITLENNGLRVLNNPLLYENGSYRIDFDGFEKLARMPETKMFILCNPHNPVGRVFTKEELTRLGQICLENDVLVIADEIHSDLVYRGHKHTIFAELGDSFAQNVVILTAPSKTFNLAGLGCSNIIIPNKKLRSRFSYMASLMGVTHYSPFGVLAVIAAYNEGEEWLIQLLDYLQGNIEFVEQFLQKHLPMVKMTRLEGTYLAWFDFSAYADVDIYDLIIKKAGVGFSKGTDFGVEGKGFMRACLGTQRSLIQEALEKVRIVVQ